MILIIVPPLPASSWPQTSSPNPFLSVHHSWSTDNTVLPRLRVALWPRLLTDAKRNIQLSNKWNKHHHKHSALLLLRPLQESVLPRFVRLRATSCGFVWLRAASRRLATPICHALNARNSISFRLLVKRVVVSITCMWCLNDLINN